jgi:hypothetical protein
MHSADRIVSHYQNLKVGDVQRLGAGGLVLRVPSSTRTGLWWCATAGAAPLTRALYQYLMEPGSLIMERKMFLGSTQRAERLARDAGRYRGPRDEGTRAMTFDPGPAAGTAERSY